MATLWTCQMLLHFVDHWWKHQLMGTHTQLNINPEIISSSVWLPVCHSTFHIYIWSSSGGAKMIKVNIMYFAYYRVAVYLIFLDFGVTFWLFSVCWYRLSLFTYVKPAEVQGLCVKVLCRWLRIITDVESGLRRPCTKSARKLWFFLCVKLLYNLGCILLFAASTNKPLFRL